MSLKKLSEPIRHTFTLRREGDSNPRYAFGVYTLSRRASSTTRASLQDSANLHLRCKDTLFSDFTDDLSQRFKPHFIDLCFLTIDSPLQFKQNFSIPGSPLLNFLIRKAQYFRNLLCGFYDIRRFVTFPAKRYRS